MSGPFGQHVNRYRHQILAYASANRRAVLNISSYGLSVLLGLATMLIVSGALQPAMFGAYALIVVVASIVTSAVSRASTIPVLRAVARVRRIDRAAHLAIMRFLVLRIAIAGGGLALVFAMIQTTGLIDLRINFLTAAALCGSAMLTVFANGNSSIVWGAGASVAAHLPDQIVRPLVNLLVVLALIRIDDLTLDGALYAFAIATLGSLAASLAIQFAMRKSTFGTCNEFRIEPQTISLMLSTAVTALNAQVEVLLLGRFASLASVGEYRLASSVANYVNSGATISGQIHSPRLGGATGDASAFAGAVRGARKSAMILAGGLFALLVPLAIYVALPLLGSAYSSTALPILILSLANLVGCAAMMSSQALQMASRSPVVTRIQTITLVLRIVLGIALIPFFGIWGACASYALSSIINRSLAWHALRREIKAMVQDSQ